jgi:hypothetical protein
MNTEYVLVSAIGGSCATVFVFRRIKTVKDRSDSNRIYEFLRRCTKDGRYTFRGSEEISTVTNLSPSRIADLCGKHRYIEGKERQRHTWRVRDESPKQDPIPPESAADQHVFGVPVSSYNAQWLRHKKTWSRWDFARRWREVLFPEKWRFSRKGRGVVKTHSNAIWDLKPVTDVKGGGGIKGKSKPTTGGSDTTGSD